MKKVLILEPYFGGSHKSFLEGLQEHVEAEYTVMTLPARKWKMRMQLSAQWFVQCIAQLSEKERWFDSVLFSTFVDVAVFKSLVSSLSGWNREAVFCLYFHENQFVYPNQIEDKTMYQFTAINFNSALAADRLAFNSRFNQTSMTDGCRKYLKAASEMKLGSVLGDMQEKSRVLYPGMNFSIIDNNTAPKEKKTPVIVWNHRWEHDKGPEEFFKGLYHLQDRGHKFKVIVLGESFVNVPECFAEARAKLEDHILHFGFAQSYHEYCRLLTQGTIIVSTSHHEFFGIAIVEGVRAGCYPLLPDRLSYPELFPEQHLYKEGDFPLRLEEAVRENYTMSREYAKTLTEHMGWEKLSAAYTEWLLS